MSSGSTGAPPRWIIATDVSKARFVVMTIALVVTLALGYVRFVRTGRAAADAVGAAIPDAEGLAAVELRLRTLEERMQEAARVLGRTEPSSNPQRNRRDPSGFRRRGQSPYTE